MKKILVLTDFSAPADAAVDAAFRMAEKHECEVLIYHCMTESTHIRIPISREGIYTVYDLAEKKHFAFFNTWTEKAEEMNIMAYFISAGGNLVDGVNDFCQQHNPDLVIMGSTGRSRKEESWGSNTENMVKYISYPLLIVKNKLKATDFRTIVYASAFHIKEKESFSRFLKLIPLHKEAVIHLVSIDTDSYFTQPSFLIHESMQDYVNMATPVKTEKHFYQDYNVRAGIRHFNEEINPDLVVMSNKIRKPVKRILLGNDAIEVAHSSPYPVLIMNYPD